jgi:thymidylate synthase (FAD)
MIFIRKILKGGIQMWLLDQQYEIMQCPDKSVLQFLERCGRTCYKSEDKICDGSAERFNKMIVHDLKHESVIEHAGITVKFETDRSCSHELVRHRLASYSQESQRYINYNKKGLAFIIPVWLDIQPGFWQRKDVPVLLEDDMAKTWVYSMFNASAYYLVLLKKGWTPEKARVVLPNSTKTEIVVTANLREWRHILKMRTGNGVYPQMRELMIPLLKDLQERIPIIFDDIKP